MANNNRTSSLYDKSRGFGSQLQQDVSVNPSQVITSKRASQSEEPVSPFSRKDKDDSDEEEEEEITITVPPISFPQSKSTGTTLCLERMDYMAKTIERMRTGHQAPAPPPKTKAFARQSVATPDASLEVSAGQEQVVTTYTCAMELGLVQATQPTRMDFRLLELLGPEGQDRLFMSQQKIVEYFRYKYTMMDRKQTQTEKMKEAAVAQAQAKAAAAAADDDDDGFGDLSLLNTDVTPINQEMRDMFKEEMDHVAIQEDPMEAIEHQELQEFARRMSREESGTVGRRGSVEQPDSPMSRQITPGSPGTSGASEIKRRQSNFQGGEPSSPASPGSNASRGKGLNDPTRKGGFRGLGRMMRAKDAGDDRPGSPTLSPMSVSTASPRSPAGLGKKGPAGMVKRPPPVKTAKNEDVALPPLPIQKRGSLVNP